MRKGFTLVELSIVLVIIGLLVGGVLIAQSMIKTTRLVSFIKDVQQIEVMVSLYKERFKALPGDDARWGGGANGNGIINLNEISLASRHLVQTGISPQLGVGYSITPMTDKKLGAILRQAEGNGTYLCDNATSNSIRVGYHTPGNVSCTSGNIQPCLYQGVFSGPDAQALDKKFDDGFRYSGKVGGTRFVDTPAKGTTCNSGSGANAYFTGADDYRMTATDDRACDVYICLGLLTGTDIE